jgi:hypothetical protein
MALHPHFPADPYAPLLPDERWSPAAEELRATAHEKLLPPLVAKICDEIEAWRDSNYKRATNASQASLSWWLDTDHLIEQADGTLTPFLEDDDLRDFFLSPFSPKPVGKTTDNPLTEPIHQTESGPAHGFVYVNQGGFEKDTPHDSCGLIATFTDFQE